METATCPQLWKGVVLVYIVRFGCKLFLDKVEDSFPQLLYNDRKQFALND